MFWKIKLMDKRKTKKKIWMLAMCLFVMCCLCSCKSSQKERYQTAVKLMEDGKYQKAYEQLKELGDYKDAPEKATESYSNLISEKMAARKFDQALSLLEKSGDMDIKDKDELIKQCKCAQILGLLNKDEFDQAKKMISEIDDPEAVAALEQEYNYQQGIWYFENKNYTAASEALLQTSGYVEANDYLFKIAQKLNSQKKYQEALTLCKKLEKNKKVKNLVEKIYLGMKYQNFKKGAEQGYMLLGDTVYYTPKQAEKMLEKNIYGKWVEFNSGKKLQIDKYTRNGKRYGIYTMSSDSGNYTIYYYYMDHPDKIYIDLLHEMNVPGYETQMAIDSYQQEGYAYGEDYCYLRKSRDYIRDHCKLPGYDDEEESGDAPDEEDDSVTASGNTSNGSSNNDSSENNAQLIAFAEQCIGQVISESTYHNRLTGAGYEVKSVQEAGTFVFGAYKVKFSVYFPELSGEKFVTVYIHEDRLTGQYYYFQGSIS